MARLNNNISLFQIRQMAKTSCRLVYGFNTCWWKLGDPMYKSVDNHKLPCGPRGEMLLETDNPLAFIQKAIDNPSYYGKHGINAFVAAYHGNIVNEAELPTSFSSWDEYNKILDQHEEEQNHGKNNQHPRIGKDI